MTYLFIVGITLQSLKFNQSSIAIWNSENNNKKKNTPRAHCLMLLRYMVFRFWWYFVIIFCIVLTLFCVESKVREIINMRDLRNFYIIHSWFGLEISLCWCRMWDLNIYISRYYTYTYNIKIQVNLYKNILLFCRFKWLLVTKLLPFKFARQL